MNFGEEINKFRNLDTLDYPELIYYTKEQIYEDFIGCGGLYLAIKYKDYGSCDSPGEMIEQVIYGFESGLYPTVYTLVARKI